MAPKQSTAHPWEFRPRFRRRAFGWRSQPAVLRVRQAVAEIRKVARKDPVLAAEGAVIFLEKVSPALEQVDSSSGAIGSAVNAAIAALAKIIGSAPATPEQRAAWLERLWEACQADRIPYLETLGDHWGTLCASQELASQWADRLIDTTRMALGPDPRLRGFFKGTTACLCALLAAGRNQELRELLDPQDTALWHFRADARLLDEAVALANASPCAPRTLTRAARDHVDTQPDLALEAGLAALHWLACGYGYEVTALDVLNAYDDTLQAAARAGRSEEARRRIQALMESPTRPAPFFVEVLRRHRGPCT